MKGDMKNYEISYELGFNEPANFAGFFKRYVGVSIRDFKSTVS
jgi:AraC-like DNA-binding protein